MPDLTVKNIIQFILKGRGDAKRAQDELDKTKKKAGQTRKGLNALGKSADQVRGQLAGMIGGVVLARFAALSIQLEANIQRRLLAIRQQMQGLGIEADTQLPRVERFLTALEETGGVLTQDAIGPFQKFLGITKDVEGAMFAVKLAADLTNAGLGDMGTNSERLANLLQGEVTEAAKSLGLQLRDQNGRVKTQTELLDELLLLYGGFSEANQDAQADLEGISSVFNQLKRDVGAALTPALKVFKVGLEVVINSVKSLGVILGGAIDEALAGFQGLGNIIRSALDFRLLRAEGPRAYLQQIRGAAENTIQQVNASARSTQEELRELWAKETEEFEQKEEGKAALFAIAQAKQTEVALRETRKRQEAILQAEVQGAEQGSKAKLEAELRLLEFRKQQAIKAAQEQGKSVAGVEDAFDAQRLAKEEAFQRSVQQFQQQAQQGLLQQQLAALDEGTQVRLDKELEILDKQREQALEMAQKLGADEEAIRETFRLARLQKLSEFNEQRAQQESAAILAQIEAEKELEEARLEESLASLAEHDQNRLSLQQEALERQAELELEQLALRHEQELEALGDHTEAKAALEEAYQDQILAVQSRTAAASIAIRRQEAEHEAQIQAQLRDQVFQTIDAVFGKSKATAIAKAIISTWVGANKALEDWGWPLGPVFAALIVAQGLATVNRIRKQEPQGFDDPANDRLAYLGGRRWATDMLNLQAAGFRDTLQEFVRSGFFPSASPVTNQTFDQRQESSTRNFNFNAPVFAGRSSIRKLRRLISEADREDRSRRIQ